jgi:opine dehydrogenase
MAGYLAGQGFDVRLWNRDEPGEVQDWLDPIEAAGELRITGSVAGTAPIGMATSDMERAISGAATLFVLTTADAHRDVVQNAAPFLADGQLVVVMACKTGGALDVRAGLSQELAERIVIAEAPTTLVNSRISGPGVVEILGVKRSIPLATLPSSDLGKALPRLGGLPFRPESDVLKTSLSNFSIALHTVPMIMNAGWTDSTRGGYLYYSEGITRGIANVMEAVEGERLRIAARLETEISRLEEYLVESLGAPPGDLYESIQGCAMYRSVKAPSSVDHKYLWEDVMAGVVPMVALGRGLNEPTPLLEAILNLASSLLKVDLEARGRSLARLGLDGLDARGIREFVRTGR